MGISAFANGLSIDTRMPVASNGNGPRSLKHRQCRSHNISCGSVGRSTVRIESSSSVFVIETNGPANAHEGNVDVAGRRHMANVSVNTSSVSEVRASIGQSKLLIEVSVFTIVQTRERQHDRKQQRAFFDVAVEITAAHPRRHGEYSRTNQPTVLSRVCP